MKYKHVIAYGGRFGVRFTTPAGPVTLKPFDTQEEAAFIGDCCKWVLNSNYGCTLPLSLGDRFFDMAGDRFFVLANAEASDLLPTEFRDFVAQNAAQFNADKTAGLLAQRQMMERRDAVKLHLQREMATVLGSSSPSEIRRAAAELQRHLRIL